ncbi:MAG: bifunctional riboflavin kinase/FAD synthetase [Bacteroidota bacterium]
MLDRPYPVALRPRPSTQTNVLRQFGYDQIARDDRAVVTTGTFDGVHTGHRAIVDYLVAHAHETGGIATVVSFHPHPREVLAAKPVPLLTTLSERADAFEALGLDRFVVLPFTRDLSLLEPEAYVQDMLIETVGLREIVIGYDHRFGRNRRGDRAMLERLGAEHGFTVDVIPGQIVAGVTVSSTKIRNALLDVGDAERATHLMGRPYSFAGTVVRGDQRGRTIGFPTANIHPEEARKLIPKPGVYAVLVDHEGTAQGRRHPPVRYRGMMNIGYRPTFEDEGAVRIEAHLFHFEGDLYGERLRVHLIARIRDERRFDGIEAIRAQLEADRTASQALLAARS